MKKLIIFLIFSFGILANELSLKIHKETNGGYLLSIPHLEIETQKGLFIHELDLDLLFTQVRGNLGVPNHYAISCDNSFGIKYHDFFMTFSLDIDYIFEENDYKEKAGLQFGNTLTIGITF